MVVRDASSGFGDVGSDVDGVVRAAYLADPRPVAGAGPILEQKEEAEAYALAAWGSADLLYFVDSGIPDAAPFAPALERLAHLVHGGAVRDVLVVDVLPCRSRLRLARRTLAAAGARCLLVGPRTPAACGVDRRRHATAGRDGAA